MPNSFTVVDHSGRRGTIDGAAPVIGTGDVPVRWDDGQEGHIPAASLTVQLDGTYALSTATNRGSQPESLVIPVLEEQVELGKRVVETGRGVRVHKLVHEHEEVIEQWRRLRRVLPRLSVWHPDGQRSSLSGQGLGHHRAPIPSRLGSTRRRDLGIGQGQYASCLG